MFLSELSPDQYVGCFDDSQWETQRVLGDLETKDWSSLTIDQCIQRCKDNRYTFAGVEVGSILLFVYFLP